MTDTNSIVAKSGIDTVEKESTYDASPTGDYHSNAMVMDDGRLKLVLRKKASDKYLVVTFDRWTTQKIRSALYKNSIIGG